MTLPILIVGAGGHARVLIEALARSGSTTTLGCTANDEPARASISVPFLGGDEVVYQHKPSNVVLVNGIGSITRPYRRRDIFLRFKRKGYRFVTVTHPEAILPLELVLGEGAQLMAGAILQPECHIGVNAIINTGAVVDHNCRIGAHTHIAPGAVLSGDVVVGEAAHVGTGARVIQGIKIGDGALIAAGAVVVRNVRPGDTVAGVPACRLPGTDVSGDDFR